MAKTLTELFEQVCPMYMTYGMTYEQFWFGDPWMVKAYQDAFLLQRRMRNEELWLQGLYIYRAVHAVVASALGNRSEKYVSYPLDYLPKTKMEKEREEQEKRNKVIRYLDSLRVKKTNQQSSKGEIDNGEPGNT